MRGDEAYLWAYPAGVTPLLDMLLAARDAEEFALGSKWRGR